MRLTAEHDQLERRAAVRVFDDRGAEFRARLLEGVHAAADAADPHLVTIYDAGDANDGSVYLATRYVPGQDLRAILIQDGALEIDRAVAIVEPVAEALGAAHSRGLVHGSVCADCILVESSADGTERSYLSDLWSTGLHAAGASAPADSGLGLPDAGVASELLDGGAPSARSDVYALGAVLAQCLAGVAPAPGSPPGALPAGLDRVVARALAVDPGERQRDGAELAAEIRAAVASRPSRRPTRPVTVSASRRRPRWAVAVGVLAVLMAVAGTVVLMHPSGGSAPAAAVSRPTGVLAFSRVAAGSDVASVSARGGVPAVLTHGRADYSAAWSPSGNRIAFLRSRA